MTDDIKTVDGAWSQMLRVFLKRLLFGATGLATAGVPLELGQGRTMLLDANLHCILADGEGLKIGFGWKGHASLKPGLKHVNVFKKD